MSKITYQIIMNVCQVDVIRFSTFILQLRLQLCNESMTVPSQKVAPATFFLQRHFVKTPSNETQCHESKYRWGTTVAGASV